MGNEMKIVDDLYECIMNRRASELYHSLPGHNCHECDVLGEMPCRSSKDGIPCILKLKHVHSGKPHFWTNYETEACVVTWPIEIYKPTQKLCIGCDNPNKAPGVTGYCNDCAIGKFL